MHSVILTELGIAVFDDGILQKSLPFKEPVKEYMAVKSKEAKLIQLNDYLASFQRGITVNDKSLLFILKKNSAIDANIMNESEADAIQASKQQILVESGFASNPHDALGKLRKFALDMSSSKVTEASQMPDLHIIQAINTLDEIDKISNALSSRLREWYGLHFPELDNIIDSINGYAQIVCAGRRSSFTKEVFEDAGFPDSKVEMLMLVATKSRGGEISDENLTLVQSMAQELLTQHDIRKNLEAHIECEMKKIAPNLSAILGTAVGARILARAGSVKRLASLPASTIQVIGAERALFRSLKTGSQPPKHGLLFQHPMVHAAPRWQRGKIARAIAAKAVIAARVDVYGEGINTTLLEKLNIRVDDIGKKYEKPVERKTPQKEYKQFKSRNKRGEERGASSRYKGKRKSDAKNKKRRKTGRR